MERIAALPGSWRAQLWLARTALQAGRLEPALDIYRDIFKRIAAPVPADFLYQMSADLGQNGHARELLALAEPRFLPDIHGIECGNNLIKAHFDLGQLKEARSVIDALYACRRQDWAETLHYWEMQIAVARIAADRVESPAQLSVKITTVKNPIWLPENSAAVSQVAAKMGPRLILSFVGSTAEVESAGAGLQKQMADPPGRMSRALPLLLAEQVFFRTGASVTTLIPLIVGKSRGFLFYGTELSDEDAVRWAKTGDAAGDYLIKLHLVTKTQPWSAKVRIIRISDGTCLAAFHEPFLADNPADGISRVVAQLFEILAKLGVAPVAVPSLYKVPPRNLFANYLLRLEQLLVVRNAVGHGANDFLNGEREILDGNFKLCVDCRDNPTTRLLLAETLLGMSKVRPDIVQEFREKATLIQKDHPLPEPIQSIAGRIIQAALNQ